jgi:NAD(P)-dependent dehydrogenase (short-subunit alcohol dehydrogenase family)
MNDSLLGRNVASGPLRAASRALGWAVNPHGATSQQKLHEAVSGRVVLITGASYGIGEATARRVAAAGATVLLVARSRDKLEALTADIVQSGGTAHVYPTDLADAEAVGALAATVLERHDHVDVLVNNAGKSIRRSIGLSYDRFHDFQRTIAINYLGPVRLLLGLLPAMRTRRAGHIVNVSTLGVRLPPAPRWAAYQASKAAFDVFLRSVAVEVADDGVTTSTVYMGLVHTRMSAPTGGLRTMPGLTPDDAAGLVCKAIVERPRVISPWWVGPMEASFALARRPWEVANALNYRAGRDTKAALSAAGAEPRPPGETM